MQRLTWMRSARALAILILIAFSLSQGILALAQTPTAEQIEIFQNLPPDQQRAVLEAIGGSRGGTTRVEGRKDEDLEIPETLTPREVLTERERELLEAGEPRLAAGDTLIVEFELLEWEGQERILTERPQPQQPVLFGPTLPTTGQTLPVTPTPATPVPTTPAQRPPDARSIVRTDPERLQSTRFAEMVRKANPYRITHNGTLDLPGLRPIPVAGLTAYQATQRLAVEYYLRDFRIRVTLLPLEPEGRDGLKPFGYDLFAGVPSTFAPVTDIPVPAEYVVGPGDRIEVQLIGSTKARHSLIVNRDGSVMFPDLGPIPVSGLKFDDARDRIRNRVSDQMIGTQAIVTMEDLRSIRVFVLGEAEFPGSYTVSSLATITNALFASGGVKPIGSLRNVQLKRNGALVKQLDLYDLLLNGDTSGDVHLQPGDVIFIPPVGVTVGVSGEIRRPAIYELKHESLVSDLIRLGGGLTPDADPKLARLERVDERQERIIVDVDMTAAGRGTALRSGDLLRVERVKTTYANSVELGGHVLRPTFHQYRSGLRLTDVIPSAADLKPNADQRYVLVRREQPGTRRIQAVSADLLEAWRAPQSEANILLAPRDRIVVFDLEAGRNTLLDPILQELRLQSVSAQPSQIVRISGRVRAPGEYPLEPGMTVSDLIRAGGGLTEEAYGGEADLARYEVKDGQTRKTEVIKIDLARVIAGDGAANVALVPFDFLVIKEVSQWATSDETVHLEGEVKFPGEYPIERGETLRSVVARAGGLSPLAFPAGSIFTRDTLKERERLQLRALADRLQQDLGTLALQGVQTSAGGAAQASQTLSIGQSLLNELRNAEPVGRLVIDLDRILSGNGSDVDVILKHGDVLRVPRQAQEVTVIGEVQNATSHLYDPGLSREDYIRLSGGTTQKADDSRIYIVRANGSVESDSGSRWFRGASTVQPGDTIVVPLDAERMRPLPLWTAVTTIIYNLAVADAAVGSF